MDVGKLNYIIASNTDPDSLYATGLPMQDLLNAMKERIHTNRLVLLLDACHSGAAESKDLVASNFDADAIPIGNGQLVICSSKDNQVSFESKRCQNGVFTEHLLTALRSKGKNTNMKDAFDSLRGGVEKEVLNDRGALQTPVMKSKWEGPELILSAIPAFA